MQLHVQRMLHVNRHARHDISGQAYQSAKPGTAFSPSQLTIVMGGVRCCALKFKPPTPQKKNMSSAFLKEKKKRELDF